MSPAANIDGVLITWGDRLFYPGNRVVKVKPQPKLHGGAARQRAAAIRERIEATVVRRVPQVMLKVTGGGRGMKAIAAQFRCISKNGRLDIEDERGETMRGKDTLHELADDWRFGGTLIDDVAEPGQRREAFNIMLSTRGRDRNYDPLWRIKAREDGRLRTSRAATKSSPQARSTRTEAVEAWMQVGRALAVSGDQADRDLARSIATFIREMPLTTPAAVPSRAPELKPVSKPIDIDPRR